MSTTALAEYIDTLFTRAHLAMGVRRWWLEMRPSTFRFEPKGYVVLRATVRGPGGKSAPFTEIEHRATMHAIEENAAVSMDVVERVVEAHVTDFLRRVEAAERGELIQ